MDPALISNFIIHYFPNFTVVRWWSVLLKAEQWRFYMLHTNSRRNSTAHSVNIAFLQAKRWLAYNLIPLSFSLLLVTNFSLSSSLQTTSWVSAQTVSTYSSPIWNLLFTLITSTATQSERTLLPNCRQPKVIVKMKNKNWKEIDSLYLNTALIIRFLPRHIPEAQVGINTVHGRII
jgi:hypothetical protein